MFKAIFSYVTGIVFQVVSKVIYNTIGNSSVLISNMVGPVEKMTLGNHPVNGLYFTQTVGPEVNYCSIIVSKF